MENLKPSDYNQFCITVYSASATLMELDQYLEIYDEILRLLFWNPIVDTQIAIEQNPNPSGVVLKGGFHG
ncbi:hypothetical protein B0F88_1058 [Methylobacter tundripaludum]|uniref:Uncharacterized protein n=1 Tax=Methylobacter tundripaludum TaxID=173365 RepID=A0A2S6H3B6_9GAMM|nr:hypothetical protein [Methylobacter tundripaludum]PPK71896.1 hypothetical protein B0F88_1058 [Methylobacter tundripaludum]